MLSIFKVDVNPSLADELQSFLHLCLLDCLVSDFFNVLCDLCKLEVPYVLKKQVFVDDELDSYFVSDGLPMTLAHARVSEWTDQKEELEHFLYLLKHANVSIAPLVDLHLLESLL